MKKVLITGSSGYTGRGIIQSLRSHYFLRGADLTENAECSENWIGDICDEGYCAEAVKGCDFVVICHMAPRPSRDKCEDYTSPALPIDINVKGTANIYHAMANEGIPRCVLVSSANVLKKDEPDAPNIGEGPYHMDPTHYGFSKLLQEYVARFYYKKHGIVSSVLWPKWIVYDGDLQTKYGQKVEHYVKDLIDPRDIGRAIRALIEANPNQLSGYYLGQERGKPVYDKFFEEFGFELEHDFSSLKQQG